MLFCILGGRRNGETVLLCILLLETDRTEAVGWDKLKKIIFSWRSYCKGMLCVFLWLLRLSLLLVISWERTSTERVNFLLSTSERHIYNPSQSCLPFYTSFAHRCSSVQGRSFDLSGLL